MSVADDESAPQQIREAAHRANESRPLRWLARAGLIANGLVHLAIGGIAIGIAEGAEGSASESGALIALAQTPGGVVLIWVAAVALFGLAVWQLTDAAWVTAPREWTKLRRRFSDVAKAIGFGGVGVVAVIVALGNKPSSDRTAHEISRTLMQSPVGVAVLVALGLVVISVGVAHLVRGVSRRFREELVELHGARRVIVTVLGLVGHVAKAVAFAIIGVLAIVAAVLADPSASAGLDNALKSLAKIPLGSALIISIAVGFMAYGLYLFARARFMRR